MLAGRGGIVSADSAVLKAQIFSHQKDFDSAGVAAAPGDNDLIAETIRSQAVLAFSGQAAGRLFIQTDSIGRTGPVSYTHLDVYKRQERQL